MASNLISIQGSRDERIPDHQLAEIFRELAELAERGDLSGFAGVAEYVDGNVDHVTSGFDDPYRIYGLLHELAEEIKQDE